MNSRSILSTRVARYSWMLATLVLGGISSSGRLRQPGATENRANTEAQKCNRADLVRQGLVVVARVVEEKIGTVIDEIGPHGPAKVLLVRSTIDADDGDISAPRLVIGIVIFPGENAIQDV